MPPAAPPIRLNALTCCLLALLACLRAPGAETTTEIGPRLARIANSQLAIEFNLATGRYRALEQPSGRSLLDEAFAQFGPHRSDDIGSAITATASPLADHLGRGRELSVLISQPGRCELLLHFAIYDDQGRFVIRTGYRNLTADALRLTDIAPIAAQAFPGFPVDRNFQTLDGNSGMHDSAVQSAASRTSSNNLLALFEDGHEKRLLLIGGLTYHDFAKNAEVTREPDRLRFRLRAHDPYGKRVAPGELYAPADAFYVDCTSRDPFAALEAYGLAIRAAQQLRPQPYPFPVLDLWYASWWNKGSHPNTSSGAVAYMQDAVTSGFLRYGPVGIMLEPDSYSYPSNQQGWWDDLHFQQYGTYTAPFETSAKWAGEVSRLGGIPLLYFQTARYSEDYALAHPEHLLFRNGKPRPTPAGWWAEGQDFHWGYDFSDPGFRRHLQEVYATLAAAGVRGIKYDYPLTGWADHGGFRDDSLTTAAHFRKIFELPKAALGQPSYLSLRGDLPDDIALGTVDALRCENDNDLLIPHMIRRAGLRWYKNRVLYQQYLDAKNPARSQPANLDGRRAMLTMNYVVAGKLMLGVGFDKLSPEDVHLLSRTVPLHAQPKSARPVDAFAGKPWPEIFDFAIDESWHQLVLYNAALAPGQTWADNWETWKDGYDRSAQMIARTIEVDLGGRPSFGGLGLERDAEYYVYDFWNARFLGRVRADTPLRQELRPGEARVLSLHRVERFPQFLSTDRHVLQGYVDLVVRPAWDEAQQHLTGTSQLIPGEPYRIVVACNGHTPETVTCPAQTGSTATARFTRLEGDLIEVELVSAAGGATPWCLAFRQ